MYDAYICIANFEIYRVHLHIIIIIIIIIIYMYSLLISYKKKLH